LRRTLCISGEQRGVTAAEKDGALRWVGRASLKKLHGDASSIKECGERCCLSLITRGEGGE
jgi:hypothetical protein